MVLARDFWNTSAGEVLISRIPQRLGQLADLDGPFLHLASDTSHYMAGSDLTIDSAHLVSSL